MAAYAHRHAGLAWITAGLAAVGVAWLALHLTVGVGPGAIAYTVGSVGVVLAAIAVHRLPVTASRHAALPYVAVCAVDIPLGWLAFGPLSWPGRVLVIAAVGVTVLFAVRHFRWSRDTASTLVRLRRQEERLHHSATHDGLTGLANRALFRDWVADGFSGEPGATVLLIDLDDFKTVNDSLGHDVGDAVLVAVAAAVGTAVRDDGRAARIGGDEFAVLLPARTAPEEATAGGTGAAGTTLGEAVARRVLDALACPIGPHGLLVQASIGIAATAPGATLDSVLHHADVAMYAAKQRGESGYLRYRPGMEQPVQTHLQLGGDLRRALDAGEFRVVYQPIMALRDRRVIGVEALVRWEHPTRGTVGPADFIPVAERTGLIVPLGRYVLRESCRQAAAWLAEFGPNALQKVAPNVSARQLHDPEFTADVADALSDHGLSSDRLVLELTESAVLRGRQVSETLHQLDRMGVKLALDDFGTGESSLSLLRSFPAAIIKLDKSFVDGIEIDDPSPAARSARQAVARAVIQLAGAFGLDAVAEGIENEAQVQRMLELGYSLGQGYHLGRPMSGEAMSGLMAEQRSMAIVT